MKRFPAPWEWDVKRLAASFVLACRTNGFSDKLARDAVVTCVRLYREAMARFSTMQALDVWYDRFEAEKIIADIENADIRVQTGKLLNKAKKVCVVEDVFPKLADKSGETPTIKDNPPFIYHHLEGGEDSLQADRCCFFSLPRIVPGRPACPPGPICPQGQGHEGGGRRKRRHRVPRRAVDGGRKDPLFFQVKEAALGAGSLCGPEQI